MPLSSVKRAGSAAAGAMYCKTMLMASSLTHARPLTTAASSASFYSSRLVPQPPDLIKWVRREGGFVHQSIKIAQLEEGSNGLGLVAAENIPKESDLISLPRHIPLKFEAADAEDGAHSTLVNLARNVPGMLVLTNIWWDLFLR